MKNSHITVLAAAALLLSVAACEKEKFDRDVYNQVVDYQFLIDNVDSVHQWCLTHSDTIDVLTNNEEVYSVKILTANPLLAKDAEVAAEGVCYGYHVELGYTLPLVQDEFYVAALRQDGTYIGVVETTFGTKELDLSREVMTNSGTLTEPRQQTFTYLYEEGFPLPGDYDFNDLVLRISKQQGERSYQVDLTVTVEAVGATKSFAGAIQLVGIGYDDIESVTILEGAPFDQGYPLKRMTIGSETLLRGRSGEAVINLFESGHYVMNNQLSSIGSVQTMFYNTVAEPVENVSATVPPVTRTYRISFRNHQVARSLSFDQIDPFIIQEYNGGQWEMHTYAHKFDEVLYSIFNGKADFYDNHVSWSVVVPQSDFRYPVEGMSLGTYNSRLGETFGPYTSFAEWMTDHTKNNDWYLRITYPQFLY